MQAYRDYLRWANLRYDEGYASYLDVLDAQRLLFEAELSYVDVQGDVFTALVGTYKAMGGGWVIEAQREADEVDFPAQSSTVPVQDDTAGEEEMPLRKILPELKQTQPTGISGDTGYQ